MTSFKSSKAIDDLVKASWEDKITDHDKAVAKAIWNDERSPLGFIVSSNGSVRLTPDHCERCGKRFRFYRKGHIIYDKTAPMFHSWKHVCIDCIDLKSDSF